MAHSVQSHLNAIRFKPFYTIPDFYSDKLHFYLYNLWRLFFGKNKFKRGKTTKSKRKEIDLKRKKDEMKKKWNEKNEMKKRK